MQPFHLFTVADIPVRMHWAYLLLAALFGYSFAPLGAVYPLLFVFCMTLSLLVHELGHALLARRFGLEPQVMLHGFGGLTAHQPAPSPRHEVYIVAAGPAAGLALALVAWIALQVFTADPDLAESRRPFWFTLETLFYINLVWSLLNLIPLWPLDGGQLFRLGARRFLRPTKRAERVTHMVGLGLGAVLAVVAVAAFQMVFAGLIAGFLAFQNFQRLQAGGSHAAPRRRARNELADTLLVEATQALARGDAREALRLGYQAKDEKGLSTAQLDAMWSVLTIASAELGEHDEALAYSLRAPRNAPVFAARVKALVGLGRADEARRELGADDAPELHPRQRAGLEALLS